MKRSKRVLRVLQVRVRGQPVSCRRAPMKKSLPPRMEE